MPESRAIARFAVIGHPVAHSRSPAIHQQFARQTGIDLVYERIEAPLDGFKDCVARLRNDGARGANVTTPFKLEALEAATRASARATRAGAANTLRFDDNGILADNTDGAGLVADLERICGEAGFELAGSSVLLLGAGGAARGVLGPLCDAGVCALTVSNRTHDHALTLVSAALDASSSPERDARIKVVRIDELADREFDIVINSTSAGLAGESIVLPDALVGRARLVYDMMYATSRASASGDPESTAFLSAASAQGAALCADGLGMLVEQAAESFLLWHGVRPETAGVLAILRNPATLA